MGDSKQPKPTIYTKTYQSGYKHRLDMESNKHKLDMEWRPRGTDVTNPRYVDDRQSPHADGSKHLKHTEYFG